MENKVKNLSDTISGIEKEIAELYKKVKGSKGTTA